MNLNRKLCKVVVDTPGGGYPFKKGDSVLVLEIENMAGHVAVVLPDGRTVYAYHEENFRPLSPDEL